MIFVRDLSDSSNKWFGYGGYYMIAGKGCQPHDSWNSLSCPLIIRNTLTRSDEGVSNYEFSPDRELVSEVRRACLSLPTGSVTRHPTRVVHPASGVWPPTAATVPAKELTFVCVSMTWRPYLLAGVTRISYFLMPALPLKAGAVQVTSTW